MRRGGLTLLEVLLVVALLAALTALAMPLFGPALAQRQLIESAEQLRSLMYYASAEAKQRGLRIELRFVDPAPTRYLEQVEAAPAGTEADPAGMEGAESAAALAQAAAGVTVLPAARAVEVRIERDPKGRPNEFEPLLADWARWTVSGRDIQVAQVRLAEAIVSGSHKGDGAESGQPVSIVFGADGRPQVGDVTVTLLNERGDGYLVCLRAMTGLATLEPLRAAISQGRGDD